MADQSVFAPVDLTPVYEAMPKPAVVTPSAESPGGSAGTDAMQFAQMGHSHPRLTSTTYATLSATGTATVMFTRSFTNKPGFSITEIDSTGAQPLVCVVQSFVMENGVYTGCVIKGYRSQALPAQPQMNVLAILGVVVAGVNNLAASLTGFNVFGGSPSGASVSIVAIARSDV